MKPFTAESVRIVFFGTPAYAVPALRMLAADARVTIELVVTQPDRPAGRGRKLTPPPVKETALELGYEVYQPETLRTEVDRLPLVAANAGLFVVAAFGKIFGPKLLALPTIGCVNLHASILPDYRGASPISASILEGNFRTGVTLMGMETGLDTGPILAQRAIDIESDDTTASLTPKLAKLGAELLIGSLDDLLAGRLQGVAQDDAHATITRPMVKADGWIDWRQSAREIERQVRAMWDWPRAWTTLDGEPLQIHRASVVAGLPAVPGVVSRTNDGISISTGDGSLLIEVAQIAGGKPLPGKTVLGRAAEQGAIVGQADVPHMPDTPLVRPVSVG